MNSFPAILVGGPPHSGKSTLSYCLSQALRKLNISHYLLRAAPDGEGDWTHELQNTSVQPVRFKGDWSEHWVNVTARDVAQRTLPLLVDVGGKPTPAQEVIFDQCTHAIVIAAQETDRAHWVKLVQAHNLLLIANLHSTLEPIVSGIEENTAGPLIGPINGLHRQAPAPGGLFNALVERVVQLFEPFSEDKGVRIHLARAPFQIDKPATTYLVHFRELHRTLHPADPSGHFKLDDDIQPALELIPSDKPIALYGRAPIRLVAAIAAQRNVRWQFDVRLGWVETPHVSMCEPNDLSWQAHPLLTMELVENSDDTTRLIVRGKEPYLDYEALRDLRAPHIPRHKRVVLGGPEGGKVPQWLMAGLAAAYRHCAHVEAWQPQTA